jgi:hypothetical protein
MMMVERFWDERMKGAAFKAIPGVAWLWVDCRFFRVLLRKEEIEWVRETGRGRTKRHHVVLIML